MVQEWVPAPRLLDNGAAVEITLAGAPRRFHALWLRDNAPDAATRSPDNGQKLITLLDIPAATRLADVRWTPSGLETRFAPEDKVVVFDPAWLAAHAYDRPPPPAPGWTAPTARLWDAGLGAPPRAAWKTVRAEPAARRLWLSDFRERGVARLRGVPVRSGAVCEVASLFGHVRETNYGRWFDVRAEVNPSNLAYTSLGLQAHTDNPYRDPVPGLQLLHCLENAVEGGESIVVDGFEAARRLREESPRGFQLLSGRCASFEFAGSPDVRLRARRPVLELAANGELIAVRFNNRSAAALTEVPYDDMADYYGALRRLAELIEDPALAVRFHLAPGDLFMVDNQRVLHARTAFAGAGARWLQGCYADRDGLDSALAVLELAGDAA